jgi:hypothetical protein
MGTVLQWLEHRGHRILLADFSNIRDEEEYLRAFDEMEEEVRAHSEGRRVPAIVDVTDSVLSTAITERARAMMAALKEEGIPDSPTAMVGMTGLQKAVVHALQFFRRDIYVAESIEDAKEWLVKQLAD